MSQSRAHLCWLVRHGTTTSGHEQLTIQARRFAELRAQSDPVVLNVTEKVVDKIYSSRLQTRATPVAAIVEWLGRKLIINPSGARRVLVSGSPRPWAGLENAFRLYGDGLMVDVMKKSEGAWMVTKVARLRNAQPDEQGPITVLTVPISFADATKANVVRAQVRTELDDVIRQSDSYLGLWRRYNEIELRNVLRRARDLGWLRYTSCRQLPTGEWRFALRPEEPEAAALEQLDGRHEVELEAGDRPPQILQEPEAAVEGEDEVGAFDEAMSSRDRPFVGEVVKIAARRWTIDLRPTEQDDDIRPPDGGMLYTALHGEQTRLERRNKAWERVKTADIEMPWLGKMLELRPIDSRDMLKIRLPSTAALRRLFGGDPTDAQRRALEVALNTPDIALIQGPPGTGKTKTIVALQAILAEAERVESVAGTTLLTSYQHDAVEHAAGQTSVLGLPAVKIGRRRDQSMEDEKVDLWRKELAAKVRDQLAQQPERPLVRALRAVQKAKLSYDIQPSPDEDTAKVLRDVLDLTDMLLPDALRNRLVTLFQQLYRSAPMPAETGSGSVLARVRALRTEPEAFLDDGPVQAYALLRSLQLEEISQAPADIALLEKASDWRENQAPPFLPALAVLQQQLLDEVQPTAPSLARATLRNQEVETLLSDIMEALYDRARQTQPGVELALTEYLETLLYDPAGVKMAVEEYTGMSQGVLTPVGRV